MEIKIKQKSTKSQLLVGNLLHPRQIYLAFLLAPPLQLLQINEWSRAYDIFDGCRLSPSFFISTLRWPSTRIPFYFTAYLYNKFELSYATGFYLIAQVIHLFDFDQ